MCKPSAKTGVVPTTAGHRFRTQNQSSVPTKAAPVAAATSFSMPEYLCQVSEGRDTQSTGELRFVAQLCRLAPGDGLASTTTRAPDCWICWTMDVRPVRHSAGLSADASASSALYAFARMTSSGFVWAMYPTAHARCSEHSVNGRLSSSTVAVMLEHCPIPSVCTDQPRGSSPARMPGSQAPATESPTTTARCAAVGLPVTHCSALPAKTSKQ